MDLKYCLHYSFMDTAPRLGEYIDKSGLYRQCQQKLDKDTHIKEIEISDFVKMSVIIPPVMEIERQKWVTFIIPKGHIIK